MPDATTETNAPAVEKMSDEDALRLQFLNERSKRLNLEIQLAQMHADLTRERASVLINEIHSQAATHEKSVTEKYKLGAEDRIDVPTGRIVRKKSEPAKLEVVPAERPE